MGITAREYGAEQPYTAGLLKVRLPFVHYRIEYKDAIQGIILSCVPLGITAAMVSVLGIPIEVAVLMVVINNFLYLAHISFGDPSCPGWITAGIPLYISFLTGFGPGPDRIKALVALQLTTGLMFLFLGLTGIAKEVAKRFPASMRAGILLGAGLASLMRIFDPKEPFFGKMPISFSIAAICSFFMLFSTSAFRFRAKYGWFAWMAGFGIAPGFLIGYGIGLTTGEIAPPKGVFDRIFISFPFGEMIGSFSALGVGFPTLTMWVGAMSLAIVAYLLAFGDILVLESLIDEANKSRPDENIPVEVTRTHLATAFRNLVQGIFVPFISLCGPQWTGAQAILVNRYKLETPEGEPSYWGGVNSFYLIMSITLLFNPLVQLIIPGKMIGFGLTLFIQGYLCIYLAFATCTTNIERGIAGVMGAALVSANYIELWHSPFWSGPTLALIIGGLLHFLLEYPVEAPAYKTAE
jgi:hypothetical protein